ncbi:hypothetical protein [Butyrivibrio sp. WCE2006]|uniref:hypothetical protein n=1 Tax=Butyrivibrio sp. WCE2006 TaxID=1410611 RepID=UPI0005D2C30F|nr:hypothetical protein [Butyrivibrio sp. WCE2006]
MDYQKLSQSLNTIDKNETELKNEYTRLYNLAEQNRKDLINTWNRFGLLKLNADAKYVTGGGTASIKGAMNAMPIHNFKDIQISLENGGVKVSYPNPAWGVYRDGAISTDQLNTQISEAMKHTEKRDINTAEVVDLGENHKVRYIDTTAMKHTLTVDIPSGQRDIELGESHNIKHVNAQNVFQDGYDQGKVVGSKNTVAEIHASLPKISIWNGVAASNEIDSSEGKWNWDDAAGGQGDGKDVLCQAASAKETAQKAMVYCAYYGPENPVDELFDSRGIGDGNTWREWTDGSHFTYKADRVVGNIKYTAVITVWPNSTGKNKIAGSTDGWFHVGEVYIDMAMNQ